MLQHGRRRRGVGWGGEGDVAARERGKRELARGVPPFVLRARLLTNGSPNGSLRSVRGC